jgi:hypothetical protein
MNSEMEALLQATAYRARADFAGEVVAGLDDRQGASRPAITAADLAVEIKKLIASASTPEVTKPAPANNGTSHSASQGESVGESVVRTAAMLTGVGPLVTGLLKLFGSGDPEPLPPLEKFSAPLPVTVEAGLTREREYSALRYSQGGTPENLSRSSGAAQSATIQVNIQAMDSQSFLDRQDDITRAVREAMLHSNSINDVVLEL